MKNKKITGSPDFPEFYEDQPHTPTPDIETSLNVLSANSQNWINISCTDRIKLIDCIIQDLYRVSEDWVAASMHAKGIRLGQVGEGEEWMILSMIFRQLNILKRSLKDIGEIGRPRIAGDFTRIKSGQVSAHVFPQTLLDKILFQRVTGEVRIQPGQSVEDVKKSQAKNYNNNELNGAVCLVLAAGNLAIISIIDFIYKLFVENKVVILKTNPVNAYINPLIERAFQVLIGKGFLQVIYGDAEQGAFLCNHETVDEIHLTGSDKTYDAIVFGSGEEGKKRKAEKNPLITKRFTAELGNVTPIIIVPGPWSEKDIKIQALKIVSWMVVNAGFNCITPRMIIYERNWSGRKKLNYAISDLLSKIPTRKAYYPGAADRHAAYLKNRAKALQIGHIDKDSLPWTFIQDVNSSDKNDICFNTEAFCSLVAETGIDADSPADFLNKAVDFANEQVWGTLAAAVLVHPKSMKNTEVAQAVKLAEDNLHYGSVCINLRAEYAYMLMVSPWGAYPEHDIYDIRTGTGVVNNLMMFDKPEKTVLRGPFKTFPDPFTATSRNLPEFGRKLTRYEYKRKPALLPGLMFSAIKGHLL